MAEQACRAYLADYLTGTNVLLTAYERRECADLSRRIQGYLLDWGQLRPGAIAPLREGACAYVGDLIIARENDNQLPAGQTGRMLANGDLLRVDAISDHELTVSRLTGYGKQTGERTWSVPFHIRPSYAADSCDLGYVLTWHTVEGRTVPVSITLANDARTRSGLYVATTRGEHRNDVYAYPSAQDPAVSVIGQGPAPDREIARQLKLQADRDGTGPAAPAGERDPITILAQIVRRDDAPLSATETREHSLSNADHLGAMFSIWQEHCRPSPPPGTPAPSGSQRTRPMPTRSLKTPTRYSGPSEPPSWSAWTVQRSSGRPSKDAPLPAHARTRQCSTRASARTSAISRPRSVSPGPPDCPGSVTLSVAATSLGRMPASSSFCAALIFSQAAVAATAHAVRGERGRNSFRAP